RDSREFPETCPPCVPCLRCIPRHVGTHGIAINVGTVLTDHPAKASGWAEDVRRDGRAALRGPAAHAHRLIACRMRTLYGADGRRLGAVEQYMLPEHVPPRLMDCAT